jgi:hypothetical protein
LITHSEGGDGSIMSSYVNWDAVLRHPARSVDRWCRLLLAESRLKNVGVF